MEITPSEAKVVLDAFPVPTVPESSDVVDVAWLRSMVVRFSTGVVHRRRRAAVIARLAPIDCAELRQRAYERARSGAVTDDVPIEVLAEALRVPTPPSTDLNAIAKVYHPHTTPDRAADAAVARLVEALSGIADEETAALIGLLVQARDATATLIRKARPRLGTRPVEEAIEEALRDDPPVRTTRRMIKGELVEVDLSGNRLPFGAGAHACPGAPHALALAAGILEASPMTSLKP